jgi:phosphopentomutase
VPKRRDSHPLAWQNLILRRAGLPVTLIEQVADVIACEGAEMEPHAPTPWSWRRRTGRWIGSGARSSPSTSRRRTWRGTTRTPRATPRRSFSPIGGWGEILGRLGLGDLFIVTGDHGNDPTIGHDKHTREFTSLLVVGEDFPPRPLAPRESLADIAATIAEVFGVGRPEIGRSFWPELRPA